MMIFCLYGILPLHFKFLWEKCLFWKKSFCWSHALCCQARLPWQLLPRMRVVAFVCFFFFPPPFSLNMIGIHTSHTLKNKTYEMSGLGCTGHILCVFNVPCDLNVPNNFKARSSQQSQNVCAVLFWSWCEWTLHITLVWEPGPYVWSVGWTFLAMAGFQDPEFCQKTIKMMLRCILNVILHFQHSNRNPVPSMKKSDYLPWLCLSSICHIHFKKCHVWRAFMTVQLA